MFVTFCCSHESYLFTIVIRQYNVGFNKSEHDHKQGIIWSIQVSPLESDCGWWFSFSLITSAENRLIVQINNWRFISCFASSSQFERNLWVFELIFIFCI